MRFCICVLLTSDQSMTDRSLGDSAASPPNRRENCCGVTYLGLRETR